MSDKTAIAEILKIKKLAEVVVNRCDKLIAESASKQTPKKRTAVDHKTKYYTHNFKKKVA